MGEMDGARPTYFLLSDYLTISDRLPDPVKLANLLANLHRSSVSPTGQFGFYISTFDGRMPQVTTWDPSWQSFFSKLLAGALDMYLQNNGSWKGLEEMVQRTRTHVIPRLLGALEADGRTIKPSLIHGDLWEGNIGTDIATGNIYIFDPCCYYAHHEMELAIWRTEHHEMKSKVYRREYFRLMPPSEPLEEWDDRNRLYCVKTKLMYSSHFDSPHVRQQYDHTSSLFFPQRLQRLT